MWKVQLFKLNYDGQESQAVKDVVDGGWITMGEKSLSFEEKFSLKYVKNSSILSIFNANEVCEI